MAIHVLPPGLELERVLASHERSTVLLVQQDGRRLVIRLGNAGDPLPGDPLPFSTVEHPALIAPIHWGTTAGGQPFILRPFAEGVTLREAVGSPGAPAAELGSLAGSWSASILGAVSALHAAGIVHRDIKASNIVVGPDGARLIDFDLSSTVDSRDGAVGTRGHIAPEVVLGQPFGPAADLFSLGATLAFAFLGPPAAPFERRFPAQPFFEAAELDPSGLPDSIASLVRALVRRHPSDRPAGARAALAMLPGDIDAPLPVTGMPPFAGRSQPFEEACRHLAGERSLVVLSVTDDSELRAAARELQLRLALEGIQATGPTSPDHVQEHTLPRDPQAVELAAVEDLSEGLSRLRRALASGCARLALVVPQRFAASLTSTLQPELTPDEVRRLHAVDLLGVPLQAIEAHLGRLTLGGSPVVVQRLAASLHERARSRAPEIHRRLQRAVQDGVLRPTRDSYACLVDRWPDAHADPADDLVARSLDRLDADSQRVLLAVAVLGDHARPSWVQEVAGVDPERFPDALATLRSEGILSLERTAGGALIVPNGAWLAAARTCHHGESLAQSHARAARLLGTADPESYERHLHELAADPTDAALASCLERAESERSAGRVGIARTLVRAVLAQAAERGSTLRDTAATVLARLELGQGDVAAAADALRAARGEGLAGAPNEMLQAAGEVAETAGDRKVARTLFQRILDGHPSSADQGRAVLGLAYSDWLDGDPARALERTDLVADLALPPDAAGVMWNLRSGVLAQLGRHDESAEALERASAEATEAGDPTLRGRTELNRAFLSRRESDLRAAADALERASTHFARAGHVKLRALAANNAGVIQRDLGRLTAANTLLLDALGLRRQVGDAHGTAVTMSNLGAVALDAGRIGDALRWLEDGRSLLEHGGYSDELTMVAASEAAAYAFAGRLDEARDALRRTSGLRAERPALYALAASTIDWCEGEAEPAARRLRQVFDAKATEDRLADRFRCARLWRALRPGSERAAAAVQDAAGRLGSNPRRLEADWVTRAATAPLAVEHVRSLLQVFEEHGRTDLVRAVSTQLSDILHRDGHVEERRQAEDRVVAATDAMVGSLVRAEREAALGHLDAISGRGASPGSVLAPDIDAAWFLGWNRRLADGEDLPGLLRSTVEKAIEVTRADRGFLVLQDGDDVDLLVACEMDHDHLSVDDAHFSRSVVRDVIRSHTAITSVDLLRESRFQDAESVARIGARAVLCVPLPSMDDARGALYVDRESAGPPFDRYDIDALETLADQTAITVGTLKRQRMVEGLNARLRERLSYREDELSLMREVIGRGGSTPPVGGLIGESEAMRAVHERIGRLAPAELPVLLSGPKGGLHDAVARALHEHGPRTDGPFLTLNLAAVSPERQADELFGHSREPGDESGWRHQGLLARANRGTLFLDSIEELDRGIQIRLLDALETKNHRTEGTSRKRDGDVRLVASCSADLRDRAGEGRLDEELFHYLSAATIRVPSLADRIEDIPPIVHGTLDALGRRHGARKSITDDVVAALTRRPWPGELRELKNEISRLYFLAERTIDDPDRIRAPDSPTGQVDPMPASYRLEDVERAAVTRALEATGNTKDRAARLLGISRAGLYKKLQRLGISPKKAK